LARYIRVWALEYGADDISFEPIVAAGANAAIPHHAPTDRVLKAGESIVIDFGFKIQGYCSDFTRTVFLKRAPKKLADIYNETEKAYRAAFNGIRAGMTGEAADALARDSLKRAKLGKYFIHSLGHSTGLEVHEQPNLAPQEQEVLENGMVFSIEPGVYVPKVGGVRIEDLVYLEKRRPHYFVDVSRKLTDNIIR
jgi:Xaa-Pro aminopeptidase